MQATYMVIFGCPILETMAGDLIGIGISLKSDRFCRWKLLGQLKYIRAILCMMELMVILSMSL